MIFVHDTKRDVLHQFKNVEDFHYFIGESLYVDAKRIYEYEEFIFTKRRKLPQFALYRGEEIVDVGNELELCFRHNITRHHLKTISLPSTHKKVKDKALIAFRIEEDLECLY